MSDKRTQPPPGAPSKEQGLSLEDTVSAKIRLRYPTKAARAGQDPYQLDEALKPGDDKKRPTDLRELSKWIKARREIDELNAADDSAGESSQEPDKK